MMHSRSRFIYSNHLFISVRCVGTICCDIHILNDESKNSYAVFHRYMQEGSTIQKIFTVNTFYQFYCVEQIIIFDINISKVLILL